MSKTRKFWSCKFLNFITILTVLDHCAKLSYDLKFYLVTFRKCFGFWDFFKRIGKSFFLRISIEGQLWILWKKFSSWNVTFWHLFFIFSEETDNGEAAKLESRLRSLSSGLIGLRHCLHEKGENMLPPTFVASSNYLQGKYFIGSCRVVA